MLDTSSGGHSTGIFCLILIKFVVVDNTLYAD